MSVMKNILLNVFLFEKIRLNFPPTWCFPKVGVWSFWENMSSSFLWQEKVFSRQPILEKRQGAHVACRMGGGKASLSRGERGRRNHAKVLASWQG